MPDAAAELLSAYARKERRALARLLTLASRGESISEIDAAVPPRSAKVVAVTGSAGVGKSTFLGRLLPMIRKAGKTAAVLACDPQSPLTGGALLGDVFRMATGADDGIFLRSVATPGGMGAVAEHSALLLRLLSGFGFDILFLETVGSGQGDVVVRGLADVVVLLTQPMTGDDLQWEKAGILEIADLIVVHKADLPGAEQTAAQLRDVTDVPIVLASSLTGRGFAETWRTIELMCAKPPRSQGCD